MINIGSDFFKSILKQKVTIGKKDCESLGLRYLCRANVAVGDVSKLQSSQPIITHFDLDLYENFANTLADSAVF